MFKWPSLVVQLQTLLNPDAKHIRIHVCPFCRGSMVPLRADVLCSPCPAPGKSPGHGQEQLKPILKTLESTVSFSFSLKFTTKTQAPLFHTDTLAHPTNCSHFVLTCRTVDQKWERRLNNFSVLKCLCIGKVFRRENANWMLSIFFTQISQSGK